MAKSDQPTTIKKYANRRLYNTGTSTYVTLEDLATMVKDGEDFLVYDAKTGDDITRSVLAQIIFEQENKAGQNLLPTTFLRQLIRFYGDSMQMVVPKYLEQSIDTLTREQEKFRKQLTNTFSGTPFAPLEEHVRRNMELFQQTFSMFKPFVPPRAGRAAGAEPEKVAGAGRRRGQHRRPAPPDEGHAGPAGADVERAEEGRVVFFLRCGEHAVRRTLRSTKSMRCGSGHVIHRVRGSEASVPRSAMHPQARVCTASRDDGDAQLAAGSTVPAGATHGRCDDASPISRPWM